MQCDMAKNKQTKKQNDVQKRYYITVVSLTIEKRDFKCTFKDAYIHMYLNNSLLPHSMGGFIFF